MNFRYINVQETNLNGEHTRVQPYIFLDKLPANVYATLMRCHDFKKLNLSNFTVSVSSESGEEVLRLCTGKSINKEYYTVLEIELRGALYDNDGKNITLNKNFLPIMHYNFQNYATCIAFGEDKLGFSIDDVSKIISKSKYVKKVKTIYKKSGDSVFPKVTRYITQKEDSIKFDEEIRSNDPVVNILTDIVTYEDVKMELKNNDIFN